MSKILEIKDVTYVYDGERLPVWEHLSCSFFEGKIHVISGPSGCGKSSVLNLLNGLIPHMFEGKLEGKVLLYGEDITETLPRYRCDRIGDAESRESVLYLYRRGRACFRNGEYGVF